MQDRWRASITELMLVSRTTRWCRDHEATSIEDGGSAKGELLLFTVSNNTWPVAVSSVTKAIDRQIFVGQGM